MTMYMDDEGNIYQTMQGLGAGIFMTGKIKKGKVQPHRVKSPALPLRKTEEAAQKDLDVWAAKKGLNKVTAIFN